MLENRKKNNSQLRLNSNTVIKTCLIFGSSRFDNYGSMERRLQNAIRRVVLRDECRNFIIPFYGEFDQLGYRVLTSIPQSLKPIEIRIRLSEVADEAVESLRENSWGETSYENYREFRKRYFGYVKELLEECDILFTYADEEGDETLETWVEMAARAKGIQVYNFFSDEPEMK